MISGLLSPVSGYLVHWSSVTVVVDAVHHPSLYQWGDTAMDRSSGGWRRSVQAPAARIHTRIRAHTRYAHAHRAHHGRWWRSVHTVDNAGGAFMGLLVREWCHFHSGQWRTGLYGDILCCSSNFCCRTHTPSRGRAGKLPPHSTMPQAGGCRHTHAPPHCHAAPHTLPRCRWRKALRAAHHTCYTQYTRTPRTQFTPTTPRTTDSAWFYQFYRLPCHLAIIFDGLTIVMDSNTITITWMGPVSLQLAWTVLQVAVTCMRDGSFPSRLQPGS